MKIDINKSIDAADCPECEAEAGVGCWPEANHACHPQRIVEAARVWLLEAQGEALKAAEYYAMAVKLMVEESG